MGGEGPAPHGLGRGRGESRMKMGAQGREATFDSGSLEIMDEELLPISST
jgi:hypothetical protein